MDEYVSSGVGSVFLVSRTRGYPTSSIYASQKQHGLCLWELWHSVIIITQYGQSSDVVEARRGQTSLGTYIYTQSQARCINNFELHLTSPIVLEVKVLLQIPIRALQTFLYFLPLGTLSSSTDQQCIQLRRGAQALLNLPTNH